jgi:uncharacterized membrane protein YphA (DoxX/SURF4 family)
MIGRFGIASALEGTDMKILLWVLQVLLAVAFLAHGAMLLFPPQSIAGLLLASFPRAFWVFLGVAEVAAAIGLILPGITRIQPWLVPAAAAGIAVVMICATIFHLRRGEVSSGVVTIVLLAMATFVTYMRWKVVPIPPRTTTPA